VRLRLLTANLCKGRADPEHLVRLVEAEAVDVACVQELGAAQAEALGAVLPHGRLEPARRFTGMGVAARRPAQAGRLALRYRPVRTLTLAPSDWPGLAGPLCVWNVHIRAPHTLPPLALAIRRDQVRELVGHLRAPGSERLVLLGDLNATPAWPAYRRLAEQLDDAALRVAARDGGRPLPTWAPRPGSSGRRRFLRLDHALTRGVRVADVRRLHLAGSDHDALCVDLALDAPAEGVSAPSGRND